MQQQREARKASKKTNRTTKSIQEFLKPEENNNSSSDGVAVTTEVEVATASNPPDPASQLQHANNAADVTGDLTIDPATPTTDVESVPTPNANGVDEGSSYAASGPQNDNEITSRFSDKDPPQDLAQDGKKDDSTADVAEGIASIELEDTTTTLIEDEINDTELTQEPAPDAVETTSSEASPNSNSLLNSLKKFCAPEVLTGDNKFACAVCTEKLAKKTKTQKSVKKAVESKGEESKAGSIPPGENVSKEEGEGVSSGQGSESISQDQAPTNKENAHSTCIGGGNMVVSPDCNTSDKEGEELSAAGEGLKVADGLVSSEGRTSPGSPVLSPGSAGGEDGEVREAELFQKEGEEDTPTGTSASELGTAHEETSETGNSVVQEEEADDQCHSVEPEGTVLRIHLCSA